MIPFLDIQAQYRRLKASIDGRCKQVFQHCQFVLGPEIEELEAHLQQMTGVSHAVTVSSGTQALQIILQAAHIGPGDCVFLPAFTYVATAEVPLLLGAIPVFVDVDPRTFQIDPVALKQRIYQVKKEGRYRLRAIIGVDLFGQAAPWEGLREIARAEDMLLVDDCAQSLGATYQGRPLGSQGDATALSFYPTKPLGAFGDGGAILTNDPVQAALYRSLRSHGVGKVRYDIQHIGCNGRMDTLQAAVLLGKLPFFQEELQKRRALAKIYDEALSPFVKIPLQVHAGRGTYSVYSVLCQTHQQRERLRHRLEQEKIGCGVYYPRPLHEQPAYKRFHDGQSLPISQNLAQCILALPLYPDLHIEDLEQIVDVIKDHFARDEKCAKRHC